MAVAVVKASGYSFDSTPSLGTSICRGSGPNKIAKRQKKIEKKTGRRREALFKQGVLGGEQKAL